MGGPIKANAELKAHIMPVQAPSESPSCFGIIKATPDAGRPNKDPPRTPNKTQNAMAWLSSRASGHKRKTISAALKQLIAWTMAGLDHLRYIRIIWSFRVKESRTLHLRWPHCSSAQQRCICGMSEKGKIALPKPSALLLTHSPSSKTTQSLCL